MSQMDDADEAWVEDEDPFVNEPEPEPPTAERSSLMSAMDYVMDFLLTYFSNPWVILLTAIGLYMFYKKYIKAKVLDVGSTYASWQEQRTQAAEVAAQKKNPDLYRQRMEAVALARERQQAEYDQAARLLAEKEKEKEEKKRAEKLEQLENLRSGKGYNNKSEQSSKSNKLKSDDYSPLMGGGSSSGATCGYRPGRRGPSSGSGG